MHPQAFARATRCGEGDRADAGDVLPPVFYHAMTIQQAADVLALPVRTPRTHYARGQGDARIDQVLRIEDAVKQRQAIFAIRLKNAITPPPAETPAA